MLRDEDTLGFIAFDDRPWEIIETGPLGNKEEAVDTILSVTPGEVPKYMDHLQKLMKI